MLHRYRANVDKPTIMSPFLYCSIRIPCNPAVKCFLLFVTPTQDLLEAILGQPLRAKDKNRPTISRRFIHVAHHCRTVACSRSYV